MRGRHGHTTDGMAEERQSDASESNAGVRMSGFDVPGRSVVLASNQTDFVVRQQSGAVVHS